MVGPNVPDTAIDRLVRYLLGGPREPASEADPMAEELTEWLAVSPQFRSFTELHRDKIRKKLRGAADTEARRDVRTELRAAHLLLGDRHIQLAFEAYGSGRMGPDFTVTFRGDRDFNLEVTRLRRIPDVARYGGQLLAKLRQLPPSAPNAVLLAIDAEAVDAVDVEAAVHSLRGRADRKDEAFFVGRGFEGTRDFYEHFLRLSAVFVLSEASAQENRATLWLNRSARIELPSRAARACLVALRSDGRPAVD